VLILAFLVYKNALKERSFYFSVLALLYSYIAVSCLVERILSAISPDTLEAMLFFLAVSALAFIYLLGKLNHKIKAA
jgi:hypothetical protein